MSEPTSEGSFIGNSIMFLVNALMMFTPTLGYFAQINTFKKMNSSSGFSKKIPLILIVSSILRIFFWFGKRFHWSLLGQAVFMTIMQLYMLSECLRYESPIELKKEKSLINIEYFWDWTKLSYYYLVVSVFTFSIYYLFRLFTYENEYLVELIGSLSALVESSLVLPQVITNYILKSTETLSFILVANWVFGDLVKTFYFLQTSAPIQLILCGITQLVIDFIVIAQMVYYGSGSSKKDQDKIHEAVGKEL